MKKKIICWYGRGYCGVLSKLIYYENKPISRHEYVKWLFKATVKCNKKGKQEEILMMPKFLVRDLFRVAPRCCLLLLKTLIDVDRLQGARVGVKLTELPKTLPAGPKHISGALSPLQMSSGGTILSLRFSIDWSVMVICLCVIVSFLNSLVFFLHIVTFRLSIIRALETFIFLVLFDPLVNNINLWLLILMRKD